MTYPLVVNQGNSLEVGTKLNSLEALWRSSGLRSLVLTLDFDVQDLVPQYLPSPDMIEAGATG